MLVLNPPGGACVLCSSTVCVKKSQLGSNWSRREGKHLQSKQVGPESEEENVVALCHQLVKIRKDLPKLLTMVFLNETEGTGLQC